MYNGQSLAKSDPRFEGLAYSEFARGFLSPNIMEPSQFDYICNNNRLYYSIEISAILVMLVILTGMMVHLLLRKKASLGKYLEKKRPVSQRSMD